MKGMYNWLGKHVHAPYGIYIFSLLVFIEGFFIVPVSTLLAFYCLEDRKRTFLYAGIATVISAFSALAGYYIGTLLWNLTGTKLIGYLISEAKFNKLIEQFKAYEAFAVFVAAFTPVPFKVLTLTAGFCKLPLKTFLIFTILGRGIRFYLIATGIYIWGDAVNYFLNKYFYYIIGLGIAFIMFSFWIIH